MFTGASNLAEGVDKAFLFIFIIAFIFIIGITAFMIYTVIHFSRKKGKEAKQFTSNMKLEILWTVVPLVLVTDDVLGGMESLCTDAQGAG